MSPFPPASAYKVTYIFFHFCESCRPFTEFADLPGPGYFIVDPIVELKFVPKLIFIPLGQTGSEPGPNFAIFFNPEKVIVDTFILLFLLE